MKKILILLICILLVVGAFFYFKKVNSSINQNIAQKQAENEVIDNIPEEPKKTELFEEYYEHAEALLETMTLEEKVSQMFLVRFPNSGISEQIQNYAPGGYILFEKDFKNETKKSIYDKLTKLQNLSKIKLIFGVDEEGGTVTRVSSYKAFRSSKFSSPQKLFAKGGLQAILDDSTEKSNLLKELGLNMNLAPVADVALNTSSFIYNRTYGQNYNETANYISELIKTMNNDGMISVMKHFPGYGDNSDTHTGIAIDDRSIESFENSDFLPFISGIENNAPCILVSHNIVKVMDENMPASLSENVHNILRNELNFSGVVITDDLAMDAVKEYAENGEAAVQALLAGNDLIITSDFEKQKQEILTAINQGRITEEKINVAVRRVLAMKYFYGII